MLNFSIDSFIYGIYNLWRIKLLEANKIHLIKEKDCLMRKDYKSKLSFLNIILTPNKHIFILLFSLIAIFLFDFQVIADTNITAHIEQDTIWTQSGSPYIVTKSITVKKGSKLTIEPGVTVKIGTNIEFLIEGTLVARGMPGSLINFTAFDESSQNTWKIIMFGSVSEPTELDSKGNYIQGSILEYVTSEYCNFGSDSSNLLIKNCTIKYATRVGINISNGSVIIIDSLFTMNKGDYAGGIYVSSRSKAIIRGNIITENSAEAGGGIGIRGEAIVTDNEITKNTASNAGGGIVLYGGNTTIAGNTIAENKATNTGGGICNYVDSGYVYILGNQIIENKTDNSFGGGISILGGIADIDNNIIKGNSCSKGAGAGIGINLNVSIKSLNNNVITGNQSIYGAVYINSVPDICKNNAFYENKTKYDLQYNVASGTDMDATDNYWGTTDKSVIDTRIYDTFDNKAKGLVKYIPFLTAMPFAPHKIDLISSQPRVERNKLINLTIYVSDLDGKPISNAKVNLQTDLGSVISPAESKGNGIYTSTFQSNTAGTASIKAFIQYGASDTEKVEIYGDDPQAIMEINPLSGKAGDTFTITAQTASSSAELTFDIGNIAQKQPMREISDGNYTGTYTVPADLKIESSNIVVTVFVKDKSGNMGEYKLNITIDTIPPPAPTNLVVEGEKIDNSNVSDVKVSASATSQRKVILQVEGSGEIKNVSTSTANSSGKVTWKLDAREWSDKDYLFKSWEEPDEVGNAGKIASLNVIKNTNKNNSILFASITPTEIRCNTNVRFDITIGFKGSSPESIEASVKLMPPIGEDRNYTIKLYPEKTTPFEFIADMTGDWNYRISWMGDRYYLPSEKTGTFKVISAQGDLTLMVDPETIKTGIKSGQTIPILGTLKPELQNQKIYIQIMRPNTQAWEQLPDYVLTFQDGSFKFNYTPNKDGRWQFRSVWDGMKNPDGCSYEISVSEGLEIPVIFPYGKVIIAIGGNAEQQVWQDIFLNLGKYIYDVFISRGLPKENIRFLCPKILTDPQSIPISTDTLKDSIINWGTKDLQSNEDLYIYMLSDNLEKEGFVLQKNALGVERLKKAEINQWLDELNKLKINVVFIMESCYSGEYIQPSAKSSQARRIIITSSAYTQASIKYTDSFSMRLFNYLHRKESFKSAFEKTVNGMGLAFFRNKPQIDSNGNGISNEIDDAIKLDNTYLGDPYYNLDQPPELVKWTPKQILPKGVNKSTFEAHINNIRSDSDVNAIVFPPSERNSTSTFDSWEILEKEGEKIQMLGDENNGFSGTYSGFTEPGKYDVFIYAKDINGIAIPGRTTVIVPNYCDVNSDGIINVLDLIAIMSKLGKIGKDISADINDDGKVDESDLNLALSYFGKIVNNE